jgi:SWI/SNF-related matrix-associated actin-dependent regulator of chromatin subfamily A3
LKKTALSLDLFDEESRLVRGDKVDTLNKLLDSLVPEKVVIFSQQAEALTRLYNICNNECIKAGRQPRAVLYRGGIAADKRDKDLERFKTDPYIDRLYISIAAGGEGLNITEAHHLVALELTESPAKNDQFISRVWRYGQKETTQIYVLYATDTVEERVIQVASDRKDLFTQATPITEDISRVIKEEKG